ncbi:alpha-glucosidase/alpha-galactosidase, partial [bacterium]|nr:alpha-glucosidase/alpha-galactosidase [bacterium]
MKIAYIGAGSIQFGPLIIQDILMSDVLCEEGLEIHLMDIERSHLAEVIKHGDYVNQKLNRN